MKTRSKWLSTRGCMLIRRSPVVLLLFIVAASLCLSGCGPVAKAEKRFFWPIASPEPKLEYVTFYQSTADIRRGVEGWVKKALLGEEVAVPLLSRPFAVASDGAGRVFVTDLEQHEVRVIDLVRHEVRALGGHTFSQPTGVAVGASGEVYVVDAPSGKLFVFGPDEKLEEEYELDVLERPTGLAVDTLRGTLYIADPGAHRVVAVDSNGGVLRVLGGRGSAEGMFNFPLDVDVDSEGNLYVLDSLNARVQVFDPDGVFLRSFGELGTAAGSFQVAKSLSVSPSGYVFVTDSKAHRLIVFDLEGQYMMSLGGLSPAIGGVVKPGGFNLPQGVDVDDTDAIWVADSLNRMIHRFQFLSEEYLAKHPILPGQAYMPPPRQSNGQAGDERE